MQDRVRVEAEALVAESAHCPQHVPAVFTYDARMCIIAMQVRLLGVVFMDLLHACSLSGMY